MDRFLIFGSVPVVQYYYRLKPVWITQYSRYVDTMRSSEMSIGCLAQQMPLYPSPALASRKLLWCSPTINLSLLCVRRKLAPRTLDETARKGLPKWNNGGLRRIEQTGEMTHKRMCNLSWRSTSQTSCCGTTRGNLHVFREYDHTSSS